MAEGSGWWRERERGIKYGERELKSSGGEK